MKKCFVVFLIFCFSFLSSRSFSQGEANIWHFGNGAGLDFNSGNPVAISSPLNAYEGCASISDGGGSLLFSTDGITVYNSTGAIMASGLFGNPSSTQSGIITPYPGSASKYYIFTVDAFGGANGMCYSIVDMTLNGGLGGIVSQNTLLIAPTCEKIAATLSSNGTDIWVVTHFWGNDQYYAYKVTPTGINPPVISTIGPVMSTGVYFGGYLTFSPNGQKLSGAYPESNGINSFELFDFDNSTGIISNFINIPSTMSDCYATTFSPDNSKLYYASFDANDFLIQYDLTNPNFATSPYVVSSGQSGFGAIQIAPDGKIYCTETGATSLSVINNPNLAGAACNFTYASFPVIGTLEYGLPAFIQQYLTPTFCNVNLGPDILHCGNDSMQLDAGAGGIGFLWSDGSTNQTLTVFTSGEYWVKKYFDTTCSDIDTIEVHYVPDAQVDLGNDTVFCASAFVVFDAGAGASSYQWSNGFNSQTIHPVVGGTYSVTVTNSSGCSKADTVQVSFHGINVTLGNDTSVCKGETVIINAGDEFLNYQWQNGSTDSLLIATGGGNYAVTVTDSYGCVSSDNKLITISIPVVNLGNDTLICNQPNFILHPASGFATYTWQNNTHNATLTITQSGNYAVTVTNAIGCSASDTVAIQFSNPTVTLGNDTIICNYAFLEINAPLGFAGYHWSTGSFQPGILVNRGGIYSVTVTDLLGCTVADSKTVSLDSAFVFIGNDTSSCNGTGIILNAGSAFQNFVWNDHSNLQQLVTSGASVYSVTVTDANGCTAQDDITISYSDCVSVIVPSGFSPNGDGVNDFFHILNATDFILGELKIYNRWGSLIFESTNSAAFWDGKFNNADCEVGVYVYTISGKNYLNNPVFKSGNVSLLR